MLTVRHFYLGSDISLGRSWPFHDMLAARTDIDYYLHVIGQYQPANLYGSGTSVTAGTIDRPYVHKPRFTLSRQSPEVWIVRGWSHRTLLAAAAIARVRRIPLLMWSERPGSTYEARTLRDAVRIGLRKVLLPVMFLPYRSHTLLLGIGAMCIADFQRLSGQSTAVSLEYPDPVADTCLQLPLRPRLKWPVLLYAGSFTRHKGIDTLIEACEAAWQGGARFSINYVGAGPYQAQLEEHRTRHPSRVTISRFAAGAALQNCYAQADGLVLPSRRDGWGLVVHEALARGIPAIVSDACGAAELVTQSGCGLVVPSNSVLGLVHGLEWWAGLSAEIAVQLGQAGRALASQLTVPQLCDKLVAYCYLAVQSHGYK